MLPLRGPLSRPIKFMDEYPGFTFSQSSSCLYQTIEENYPVLFEKIKKKVASGQWELVGGRVCEGDLNSDFARIAGAAFFIWTAIF